MSIPKLEFTLDHQEYDSITRFDFWTFTQRVFTELTGAPFRDNWHIEKLCGEVDRIRTEPNTRLAIALPPRSLKSVIVSVALPAWLLGDDPGIEIVCASYGHELADDFGAKTRRIMQTPWYRRLFPATRLDKTAAHHLTTSKGGKRFATSVDGAFTGSGADVVIVDDSLKADEAQSETTRNAANGWVGNTVFARFDKKLDVRMIVVQQRLHEDDIIGHVVETGLFELLAFPSIAQDDELHTIRSPFGTRQQVRKEGEALHPEREPLEVLDVQRRMMGNENFEAQYQQNPSPPGGGLVKLAWFPRYNFADRPHFVRKVISWDTASKTRDLNSYSAASVLGVTAKGDIYLIHQFRERLEYPELKRKVRELADQFRANQVLIEDASSGVQLIQELKRGGVPQIEAIKPTGEKIMRMRNQTATIEQGLVWLPREAPWLDAFERELTMFPKGKYDDQVDSFSQALENIGRPEKEDGYYELVVMQNLAKFGLKREDLSITFDHTDPAQEYTSSLGRVIKRKNGFFKCCYREWESFRGLHGVTLIDGAEW